MFSRRTESAGSSPSKSPQQGMRGLGQAADTDLQAPRSHKGQRGSKHRTPADQRPAQPPLPDISPAAGWNIPAVRLQNAAQNRNSGRTAHHTGPSPSKGREKTAAKIGRRQAWLKFLAYDGAFQVCLDSLLKGESGGIAAEFLLEGCAGLREALGLSQLLLGPMLNSVVGIQETPHVYWDDREECGAAVDHVHAYAKLEDAIPVVDDAGYEEEESHTKRDDDYIEPVLRSNRPGKLIIRTEPSPGKRPLPEFISSAGLLGPPMNASGGSIEFGLDAFAPVVQASVIRVVGCPLMETPGSGRRSDASSSPPFSVVLHPPGGGGISVRDSSSVCTSLTASGATLSPKTLQLDPDASIGTILVELRSGDRQLAAGTVQVAELLRCAVQRGAMMDDDGSAATGFFRSLVPGFARRKLVDGSLNGGTSSGGGSMCWVRLVDGEGGDAGTVVLAAKVVPTTATGQSGGREEINGERITVTPPPKPTAPPPSTAMVTLLAKNEELRTTSRRNGYPRMATMPGLPMRLPDVTDGGLVQARTTGGYLHANAQHVYDVLLEAALAAGGCGPTSLVLRGPWAWVLERYAARYGVRTQYATLAYLRWVVRHDNAAPTAACLNTLLSGLEPLFEQRDSAGLTSSELALLGHVLDRVDALLISCYENYFALSEEARGGLADGILNVGAPGTPPALLPAGALLEATRGTGSGPDGGAAWLEARLKVAARKRFHGLLAAAEARNRPPGKGREEPATGARDRALHGRKEEDPTAAWSYGRVEEVCACVIGELRADEALQGAGVVPGDISLPGLTAVEYVRGAVSHVHRVLQRHPPPAPTEFAVRLVEAVGQLQSFLIRHRFADAAARLDSREIFGGFVSDWIVGTTASLRRTVRAIDRAGPPAVAGWADLQGGANSRVIPLVESMLAEVEAAATRYERIVAYWPSHAQELEAALVDVLREATSAASRQCGLVQTKMEGDGEGDALDGARQGYEHNNGPHIGRLDRSPTYMQPHSHRLKNKAPPPQTAIDINAKSQGRSKETTHTQARVAWRWVPVGLQGHSAEDCPQALSRGINPHQALLLNSLRRLLAVVPQLEALLRGWCTHPDGMLTRSQADPNNDRDGEMPAGAPNAPERVARDAPDLGAHWAQLVKEIRTEYYACCTLTVEALAGELATAPATSVIVVLRREALVAPPANVVKQVQKVLRATSPVLRWLGAALDGRVFVALGRGLWDLSARDVLRFAEDLSEEGVKGAWRARQVAGAALRALDAFYRSELASAMGSDLLDRDMTAPQHAQRAAALLADNTMDFNMSFDVY